MELPGWRVYIFYILIDSARLFPKWVVHYIFTEHCWVPFLPDPHITRFYLSKTFYQYDGPNVFLLNMHFSNYSKMEHHFIYLLAIFVFSSLANCLFISFPRVPVGLLVFFMGLWSLCIFWIAKGRSSRVRLPASEPCLCHLQSLWVSHLASLCLYFLICYMRLIMSPIY